MINFKSHVAFIIVFICFLFPLEINAQAKPKRNIALDNISSVNKKNNGLISKQSNRKTVSKRKRQRRSRSYRPKEATYLTVNGSQSPTIYANSSYDKLIVGVETDGADWNIRCVGNWYKVYKKSSREIEIDVENNFSHDKRNDWFLISSGNKQVNVNISQLGKPINAYAEVYNMYLIHDVTYDGQKMLQVNADVYVTGAAGQKLTFYCFVEFPNGEYMKITNSDYVCAYTNLEAPATDNRTCYNVKLLIPNNNIQVFSKRKSNLKLEFKTFCYGNNSFIDNQTNFKWFRARRKRNQVETMEL